ncbi:MAG: cobalt-precorrin-5B (C1)-methyltransferase [Paracoccaceae bacterium]|jgi:cobalt-precorrin-5B (C1)-methyltransferase
MCGCNSGPIGCPKVPRRRGGAGPNRTRQRRNSGGSPPLVGSQGLSLASAALYAEGMNRKPDIELRRGWTTGACATAAVKSALSKLWTGAFVDPVSITLPRGEQPVFPLAHSASGHDWAEAGITKDAGDDPDVTHGCLVIARVMQGAAGTGVVFHAGAGVGIVTRPGLPVAVGEPAVNPVPRAMMVHEVTELALRHGYAGDVVITLSIPGGDILAAKTWNPRLGIAGGLSVLGTTGIVRPFSCAAWIASIHRGIDVARADGLRHVGGCTGATSERVVQTLYGLPDHAMLDMGDFAGGLLKYLARHPVDHITIGGGIGKMTKLSQGARDLHSGRSQVDLQALAKRVARPELAQMNTALEAVTVGGARVAEAVATDALGVISTILGAAPITVDVVIIDRAGVILARSGTPP